MGKDLQKHFVTHFFHLAENSIKYWFINEISFTLSFLVEPWHPSLVERLDHLPIHRCSYGIPIEKCLPF